MKFEKYLSENRDSDEVREMIELEILPTIKRECKQFLKEDTVLYRGKRKPIKGLWDFVMPRKDRKPTDVPEDIQKEFDEGTYRRYKVKFRQWGVFVTPYKPQATTYGSVYTFWPKDGYKYLWSPKIRDFFDKWNSDVRHDPMALSSFSDDYWDSFVVDYYQTYGIKKNKAHEMMFYCPNGYYLVHEEISNYVIKGLY